MKGFIELLAGEQIENKTCDIYHLSLIVTLELFSVHLMSLIFFQYGYSGQLPKDNSRPCVGYSWKSTACSVDLPCVNRAKNKVT